MRFLATKIGCYNPRNAMQSYCHDNLMDAWGDVMSVAMSKGVPELETSLGKFLCQAEKQMNKHNGEYVAGDKPGPGDFWVASWMLNWHNNPNFAMSAEHKACIKKCYDACPKVNAMVCKLAKQDKLCAYLAKRPARPY